LGDNTYIYGSAIGNALCSYLKQQKCLLFFLSFAKLDNRREEQVLPGENDSGVENDAGGEGEEMVKGCRRVNMLQIYICVNMNVNGKMIPVETISQMEGGGIKENG
jgi:hypothetical protein